ncbi:MAG: serine/threonine-protein kinase [Myxococcales bacterium]|nr:serine/threonine-protein kinase [Myxococcales bacterium]
MAQTLGKYTLVRKLATGGMAEVFLARSDGPMGFQKKLVVKRILPHFGEDQNFINMFLSEARLAAELNHPNVVQIFDFGETDGQYYIAMEFIDGPNLRALNKAARETVGPISLPLCARIIALAAEGLGYAHDLKNQQGQVMNLVHRDISPDNVLVSRNGGVKVVDFGIAKASTQPHLTKSGVIKGKLAYMPPEQLAREQLDRRADIFALGVVLYELVCGAMPFDSTSEVSIIQAIMGNEPLIRASNKRHDLPPALDAIISKCIEKTVANRYSNCRELQHDLERFIASTGEVVSVADVGKLVEHLFPEDHEATLQNVLPPAGIPSDKTFPSMGSQERSSPPVPTYAQGDSGTSSTQLRSVAEPKKSKAPLFAGVGLAVIAIGVGAFLALKPPPTLPVEPVTPVVVPEFKPLLPVAVVDAGAPELDAGAAVIAAVEVDAGAEPDHLAVVDAGAKVVPPALRMGRIDFRIRPVGRVFLDGKLLGETPLGKEIPATVGVHTVKVIEPGSNKVIERTITVKPGPNSFTHNFTLEE